MCILLYLFCIRFPVNEYSVAIDSFRVSGVVIRDKELRRRTHWRGSTLLVGHVGTGAQTVGRKTSWAKDVWANYFLGDRRLGDKLGRYGDSKSDGWATFFRRLGEMGSG